MSGSDDSIYDDENLKLPNWYTRAKSLFSADSATIAGYSIWSNPAGWVLAILFVTLTNSIETVITVSSALYLQAAETAIGAYAEAALAFLPAFSTIEWVLSTLLRVIGDIVVAIASFGGPFAPLIVVAIWAGLGFIVVIAGRALIKAIPLVIPWL